MERPATSRLWKGPLQVIVLLLLLIPIVVIWQFFNNRLNNTDPTVAGHPLSNPQIHLHTMALGGKPGVVYLGTHFGLLTSTDGGRTWPQPRGVLNTLMILTIAVSPKNAQDVAIIGRPYSGLDIQGGIYFSTDGGAHWQKSNEPAGLSPSAYLFTVLAGTAGEGHFYAFYDYAGWFETRDMGKHWRAITSGTVSNMLTPSLLTDPTNPDHLWLGGDQGLFESQDDGSHWKQIPAVSGSVLNIVASNTTPRLIYCTTDQGIFHWREGSSQVSQLTNVPPSFSPTRLVISADGRVLYALAGQDLWYSDNSGITWKHRWQFDRGDLVSLLVDPLNPQHLYAGFFQPAVVMSSTDGGSSWQILTN